MTIKWEPLGYRVLVKFEPVEEKVGSIIIADQTRKLEQQAQVVATILSYGPDAFDSYNSGIKPEIGAKVLVSKYGGWSVPGDESKLLQVYNDEDIAAVGVNHD